MGTSGVERLFVGPCLEKVRTRHGCFLGTLAAAKWTRVVFCDGADALDGYEPLLYDPRRVRASLARIEVLPPDLCGSKSHPRILGCSGAVCEIEGTTGALVLGVSMPDGAPKSLLRVRAANQRGVACRARLLTLVRP